MSYNPEVRKPTSYDLIQKRITELENKRKNEGLSLYENLELQNLVAKIYSNSDY